MLFGILAGIAGLVFLVRVMREPRRVSNAVWFGILLFFGGLWALWELGKYGYGEIVVVLGLLVLLIGLVLPFAMVANGVIMLRRESFRPANLLSLLTGLAVLGLIGFTVVFGLRLDRAAQLVLIAVILVTGYFAFLFASLLAYSFVYGQLSSRARADAVVVLGSGLIGDRVPPLLAARIERGLALYRRDRAAGGEPVLVVSGGQGPGETTTEAAAMRDYLLARGVPAEHIVLEDRARTTEENLRFSAALVTRPGARIVAVTNNYHVFRTAVLSYQLKLRMRVVGSRTALYFLPSAFIREFVALLMQYRVTTAVGVLAVVSVPALGGLLLL
ncbi:YdcF family protein [Crossiella sp. CA-258035]|uniref:YdcF family protein n=1 Tax=Crossiella sp. CA-258035 TaxID=2981138 RepID=UPI0024BC303D|nr:YdcF family protein [Crossiella sp. CA-258035]WHT22407.1 YdcF family protein [Crossiella sp. CA-258035]